MVLGLKCYHGYKMNLLNMYELSFFTRTTLGYRRLRWKFFWYNRPWGGRKSFVVCLILWVYLID